MQEQKTDEPMYTYFRIDFVDCGYEFDYTVVETIHQIKGQMEFAECQLDDDTIKAKVVVTGIGLTKKEWLHWQKTHELPYRLPPQCPACEDLSAPASPVEEKREGDFTETIIEIFDKHIAYADSFGIKSKGIIGKKEAAWHIHALIDAVYEGAAEWESKYKDAQNKLDKLAESKPSPVIEIGERETDVGAMERIERNSNEFVYRNTYRKSGRTMTETERLNYVAGAKTEYFHAKAFHPAPAPIVGEREEEDKLRQQLLAALEETSEAEELAADRLSLINFQANQIAELKSQVIMWQTQLENFRKHFTDSGTF